jgi:hypothetical protein
VELDVRVLLARGGSHEAAGLEVVRRAEAVAPQEPAQADEELAPGREVRRQRPARDGELEVELEVVLEVRTDAVRRDDDVDAEAFQQGHGADAGDLQELGRRDGARAEDDLLLRLEAPAVGRRDGDGARPVELDPGRARARDDVQRVVGVHGRLEVGREGRAALAPAGALVEDRHRHWG